jgi:HSP20 family protein
MTLSLTPWRRRSSLAPVSSLQQEMNRVFEDFFTSPYSFPITGESLQEVIPAVDLKEDDGTYTVTAELPGVDRDNVEINIKDDMLEIKGTKSQESKREEANLHIVERSYGSFARRIRLPGPVDSEKAKASMDKGVLTLQLPKVEPKAGMKKIAIG